MEVMNDKRNGVYKLVNANNEKLYVGSASKKGGFKTRTYNHVRSLENGTHYNNYLQHSHDKHGADAFRFEIIECCEPKDCKVREQFWIDTLEAANPLKGYNINPKADSRLGSKNTEASKRRMSTAQKGKKRSAEVRAAMSVERRERNKDPEQCKRYAAKIPWAYRPNAKEIAAKISKTHTGKKQSPEQRAANSAARTKQCAEKRAAHKVINDGLLAALFAKSDLAALVRLANKAAEPPPPLPTPRQIDGWELQLYIGDIRPFNKAPGYFVGRDGSMWSAWVIKGVRGIGLGRHGVKGVIGKKLTEMTVKPHPQGSMSVSLRVNGKNETYMVQNVVWDAFKGERPTGTVFVFKDGNRSNCKLDNLDVKETRRGKAARRLIEQRAS